MVPSWGRVGTKMLEFVLRHRLNVTTLHTHMRAAIVSEVAGTTRDRVARRIDLSGVVVEWIDTPGIRASDDPIERAAIEARRVFCAY